MADRPDTAPQGRPGLVLALDTSIDVRAGLARDGEPLAADGVPGNRQHVEQLLPVVDRLLAGAGAELTDVARIVAGIGPGPFTGLRVGIATAEALAFALQVPWSGVCGLDVLAAQWHRDHPGDEIVAAIDARRHEVYWARYTADGGRVEGPSVGAPDELPDLPVVGPGAGRYAELLGDRAMPGPDHLDAALMAARPPADAGTEPLYLRRPDATEPTRRKSTLPRMLPPVSVSRGDE